MRAATFPIFVLGALLVLGVLQWRPPVQDPFSLLGDGEQFTYRNGLAVEISHAKVAHARDNPRYRVGLFGNSGPMVVGAGDVGLSVGEFFNFAIGGGSLRHSVAMIEELERYGKVPETLLITFDHVETQFIGNAQYPSPPRRWLNVARDVIEGFRRGSTIQEIRFTVERSAIIEWALFQKSFSYDHMRRSLASWFPGIGRLVIVNPSSPNWVSGFAKDGSRHHRVHPALPGQTGVLGRRPRLIIPAYLDYDLERLAGVAARTGARVIVFEAIIEFDSATIFAQSPSPFAPPLRERFLRKCVELGLECHAAPMDAATLRGPSEWESADHAPAGVLGRYLSRLIRNVSESP